MIYRIDSLTKYLNVSDRDGFKSNVFTLKHRSEIDSLISSLKKQKKSYSQYGDDLIILDIFRKLKIEKPSYIDIGAHHPKHLSNTALLYELGSSGINVEANPVLLNDFENYRERDINLNVGVGAEKDVLEFTLFKNSPALSTFDQNQVKKLLKMGKVVEKVIDVEVNTVSDILESYWNGIFPDFLSLDVEGSDLEILSSINFEKSKPKVICVEINEHDSLSRIVGIEFLLFNKGYFHFGDIGGGNEGRNAIFVDSVYLDYFS